MNKEEIIEKLKEIFQLVVHNGVSVDNITEESVITRDLGVDSVGLIYLAIAIEKTFEVDMSEVTINTFKTIGDVIQFIQERV